MRFCANCGRKLAWGDSELCGKCEAKAEQEDQEREDESQEPTQPMRKD